MDGNSREKSKNLTTDKSDSNSISERSDDENLDLTSHGSSCNISERMKDPNIEDKREKKKLFNEDLMDNKLAQNQQIGNK